MSTHGRQVYEAWLVLQDLMGSAKKWPKVIRRIFWTKNLKHWNRILLCTFCYVNGLNPVLLIEWVELMGLCRDGSGIRHITALFKLYEKRSYRLYAYNVAMGRYEYLDGTVRHYVHRSLRN